MVELLIDLALPIHQAFAHRVTEAEEVIVEATALAAEAVVLALLVPMLPLNTEEVPEGLEFNHPYQEQLPTTLVVAVVV